MLPRLTQWKAALLAMLALLAASLVTVPVRAELPRDPSEFFFDQTLGDFSEELAMAREEGKQGIMLFFEMDECPFCHRMKQAVLNQPEVQDYFRAHFRIFSVDIEGDVEIMDFQGQPVSEKDFAFQVNRVRATPVILFIDLEGNPVARYTGATSGVEEFMWLGEFVVEGAYKDMSFVRYKRARRQAGQP